MEVTVHRADPAVPKDTHFGEQSRDGFSSQLVSFAGLPNNAEALTRVLSPRPQAG